MKKSLKTKTLASSTKILPLATAVSVLLAGAPLHAATITSIWQVPGTTGNWSVAGNWDTALTSSADSIASIAAPSVTGTTQAIIDQTSWTLYGLNTTSSSGWVLINAASPNTVLNLGAGGITHTISGSSGSRSLWLGGYSSATAGKLTVNTTADQTWSSNGTFNFYASLSGAGKITIDNSGTGLTFYSGNSTSFTGSFAFKQGSIAFADGSQLSRLGTNAMEWSNTGAGTLNFGVSASSTNYAFSTPITFTKAGNGARLISLTAGTSVLNSSLVVSGAWSGNLDSTTASSVHGIRFTSASVNGGTWLDGNKESQFLVRLQQDGSGLTSTKAGTSQNDAAFFFGYGSYSVENTNALGTNNSLSVAVGDYASALSYSALLTNSGIDIASKIYICKNSASRSSYTKLGLLNTGSAKFTGDIVLGQVNPATTTARAANVHLSAGAGSTLTFSGNISDEGGNTGNATVTADGGGKIVLSGSNINKGGVSVVANTTLAANGVSSTGVGGVKIGAASASFTGDTLASGSNWRISNVSSTAGLVVGQTITGAGIAAGTTITYIGSNYIEVSNRTTAAGTTVNLSAAAELAVLSGTGRLAPGVVNSVEQSITVAAGSSIAPGDGGIGALTLDGGATTANTAALLTMASGAYFTFELGTANNSDQLIFWNFTKGDLALNNNTITLSDVQAGTFTLFKFYGDNGITGVSNDMISDLTKSLTLSGYDSSAFSASLNSVDNNIILSVAAVPEPATWAMMVGGVGMLAFARRLRKLA